MKDNYVEAFHNQTFNQDGYESAILKIKYYNPHQPDLIFHHLTVKEKVENKEVNRLRNGYKIDTIASVDICEINKIAGKVIQNYEAVISRENSKTGLFRKIIEKVFAARQKYTDEKNDLMQRSVKLQWLVYMELKFEKIVLTFTNVNLNIERRQSMMTTY